MAKPRADQPLVAAPKRSAVLRVVWNGLKHFVATEHSWRFHALAVVLIIGAGLALDFAASDWRWVILGFAIIWITEALNTAVERLGDAVAPARNKSVGLAKDVAASAVFIAIMAASLIGVSLFLPHLVALLD